MTQIEDSYAPRFDVVVGDFSDRATTIRVKTPAVFAMDDIAFVSRTGEVMRVMASTDDGRLNVERSVGSKAAPIRDDDEILVIGRAQSAIDSTR